MKKALSSSQPRESNWRYLMAIALASLLHLALAWWLTHATAPRVRAHGVERESRSITVVLVPSATASPALSLRGEPAELSPVPRRRAPRAAVLPRPSTVSPTTALGQLEGTGLKQASDATQRLPTSASPAVLGSDSRASIGAPLILPDHYRDTQPRQKSYAEMANEQLNPGGPRNSLAEGIKKAVVPECTSGGGLLGLPVIIYKTVNGKCR